MKQIEIKLALAALRDDVRRGRLPSDTTKTLRRLLPILEDKSVQDAMTRVPE